MRVLDALLIAVMIFPASICSAEAPKYEPVADWLKTPPELEHIGNAHGDIAISSNGDVYVSIIGGPKGGIQVYDSNGNYLRNVPDAPKDFHGFVIHKDADGEEYIYGARLFGQTIQKLKLDGTVVLEIPRNAVPEELILPREQGRPMLLMTCVDVAPDGRIFAVDGYASDLIHIFSPDGKYLDSFGGKKAPYNFQTLHKMAVDTRFDPPRLLCCDREGRRILHLSLDGEIIGEPILEMKRPAAVVIHNDLAAVGEIEGRISLIDKEGNTIAVLGENSNPEQTATNEVLPEDWKNGIVTAPHGVIFDSNGNLFVTEYNKYGRVIRYDLSK